MFQNPLTEEEHEELANTIREFFIYRNYQAEKRRVIFLCIVILIIFVLLAIWLL